MDNPTAEMASSNKNTQAGMNAEQKKILIISSLIAIILLVGFTFGVYWLLQSTTDIEKYRDLFIIALTIEVFLLGTSAFVLVIQITRLINLIQNEVQPVLTAANETINTLRGTAFFLSDNLIKPVVKVNSYIAALKRMVGFINTGK